MDSVSGIFNSRADAERAIELLGATRAADEHLVLLSPRARHSRKDGYCGG